MADLPTSKTFTFELVSPERIIATEEVGMVVIPGTDGDIGALAEHAPLVSTIRPGVISVYSPAGEIKKIFVSGGFADVSPKLCSVLAEEAISVGDIDKATVEQEIKDLAAELANVGDDEVKKAHLIRDIDIAGAKLKAAA